MSVVCASPRPRTRCCRSFHGAVKDREFTDAEIDRLARYQMATIEKWYTPCGSAGPPHQSGPECAVERKAERAFGQIRARASALGLPRPTAILYWNSMFDFSMYAAHQGMVDLEAEGVHAFLRDENGAVISLCNDGDVYCNITTYNWVEPKVRELWIGTVMNATAAGIDGIFADHSSNEGTYIGLQYKDGVMMSGPNQLCNGGKGANPWKIPGARTCYNFSSDFAESFNSWHMWATNFTQDLLSKTTGGPVIQGPLASMNNATAWAAGKGKGSGCQQQPVPTLPGTGCIVDPDYCSFDSILEAQNSGMAVFEAHGPCIPTEACLAAYLAAAEPGTYIHCTYNGDDLLNATT